MPDLNDPNTFFPPHHRRGLFLSDAWNHSWLKHWGDHPALEPLAGANKTIPDLYRYREYKKRILPITTAIPPGVSSRDARSIRCEYLCITQDAGKPEPEINVYLNKALQHRWDQLRLPDILEGTEEHRALINAARSKRLYVVEQERETAYAVDLRQGSFSNYLETLGQNTRLKLFNRRKRLAQKGEVKLENLWPDRNTFYQLLNDFHQARWGKPCYQGRNLEFIDTLLTGLTEAGHNVDLSVMTLSGKPISAALDITAQGRCYNLQSGYIENLIKGISLGTLHLGYQIEKAFEADTEVYDFMAGAGKNAQYKAALANTQGQFISLGLVRNPLLKTAYKLLNTFI